jgi:diguanylate cyclase (GGDEF)-like protein
MLLTAALFIVTAIPVSWSARTLAESIIEQWASRYIIKQTLYDKSRTLQPILRELALSKQLTSSSFIKHWAHNPNNQALTQAALKELENYRLNFQGKNYFVALLNNGNYYHNNATKDYLGNELRYTLNPNKDADSWFYNLIEQGREMHINVNPDIALGVTKLWIDVLIKDGDTILGMAGTGLDLTDFLNQVVEESEPGILSLFIDHSGAIQLHRNKSLIDFGSVSKNVAAHKTIDLIFEQQEDRENIYSAMKQLEAGEKQVVTNFVTIKEQRQLVGVVYLPEIDWYEITLIDLGTLLPLAHFYKLGLLFVLTLLLALVLLHFALSRLVLNPISQLDRAMGIIEKGQDPSSAINTRSPGELGRLIKHFMQMARTIIESQRDLEQKVQDRTLKLKRLAQLDPLTELYNRRGMRDRIEEHLNRVNREHSSMGLLWLDLDWFKEINDTHGHQIGDDALIAVADIIKATIRSYDFAARWGGDEFLVLIMPADADTLSQLAERMRAAIATHQFPNLSLILSVSIGGAFAHEVKDIETLINCADQALYKAKEKGRNCFYMHQPNDSLV